MLEKKYKYLVIGFALILFVLPSVVQSGRLDDPRENRECYKTGLPFYVCVIQGTMIMEASFMEYQQMHDYYTPQLKETAYTVGNQAIQSQNRTINTMTITGSPLYLYTKGKQ